MLLIDNSPQHWEKYINKQVSLGRPVRALLESALNQVQHDALKTALDIGAGAGIETAAILNKGFQTVALEPATNAEKIIERTVCRINSGLLKQLSIDAQPIQDYVRLAPQQSFGLIYAGYSLPYVDPKLFADTWHALLDLVASNGILAVDLFGPNDEWAKDPAISSVDRGWLVDSLAEFDILQLDEVAERGTTFSGSKFWHTYSLIARRKEQECTYELK